MFFGLLEWLFTLVSIDFSKIIESLLIPMSNNQIPFLLTPFSSKEDGANSTKVDSNLWEKCIEDSLLGPNCLMYPIFVSLLYFNISSHFLASFSAFWPSLMTSSFLSSFPLFVGLICLSFPLIDWLHRSWISHFPFSICFTEMTIFLLLEPVPCQWVFCPLLPSFWQGWPFLE